MMPTKTTTKKQRTLPQIIADAKGKIAMMSGDTAGIAAMVQNALRQPKQKTPQEQYAEWHR